MDALLLLLRWMHIFGVVLLVGGLCFSRFALLPALADTEEDSREKLQESIRRKWLPWTIIGITLLLVSGLANFLLFNSTVKAQGWGDGEWMKQTSYHAIFGVKFLLALVVFYFASGLVGRGSGTAWIRSDRARWLGVTLGLAVAIIMLSGWLRNLHTGPNQSSVPELGVPLGVDSAPNDTAEQNRYKSTEAGSAFREQDASEVLMTQPTELSSMNNLLAFPVRLISWIRKQKRRIDVLQQKITKLQRLLTAEKEQPDDPAEIPRIEAELAKAHAEMSSLKSD